MKPLMISVSGIRGIVGESLTPDVATAYAASFGMFCQGGRVIVGRDTRTSGEMMRHAVLAGLLSVGCDVLEVGIAPTPTIQLAVEKNDVAGGIAITASHNPAEWNALKFFHRDGLFLDEVQSTLLRSIRDSWQVSYVHSDRVGKAKPLDGAIENHINAVLKNRLFDLSAIRKRNFKVAVDAVCGAGGMLLPQLLAEMGC
ncbi:MAG: phosphoglucosamine mutase, partial [bacterium]